MFDSSRVVKSQETKDVAWFKADQSTPDCLTNCTTPSSAVTRGMYIFMIYQSISERMQCDDTQTNLYLSVLDVVSTVDQEADKLSGTGTLQLGGIVLLLDETCFGIDHQM